MNNTLLSEEIAIVEKLPFVSHIAKGTERGVLVVNLIPPIVYYLPQNHWAIEIPEGEFTANNVLKIYRIQVIDHLNEALDLAEQLLKEAV